MRSEIENCTVGEVPDVAPSAPNSREPARDALVELGKPAVESLIACLKDQDRHVRGLSANALGTLGDARAVAQFLLADVRSGSRGKIESAVSDFIGMGEEESVPELIHILNEKGNIELAETYLNCGHDGLVHLLPSLGAPRRRSVRCRTGASRAGWAGRIVPPGRTAPAACPPGGPGRTTRGPAR